MPNWQQLIQATQAKYRFVVISSEQDGLEAYLDRHALPLPVVTEILDAAIFDRIKAGGTPQTIVVGQDGIVKKAWRGAYRAATKAEVEQYFGVTLPITVGGT